MRKRGINIRTILSCLLGLLLLGCSVHEWPKTQGVKHKFTLHMNFDTVMDVHQIIEYPNITRTDNEKEYDLRYIVRAYAADKSGNELDRQHEAEFIFSKDAIHNDSLELTADLELEEGNYRFFAWVDYVSAGTTKHKFYNTDNFASIKLNGDKHYGSTDFRDAYRGEAPTTIIPISKGVVNEVTIPMERPLAKFNVISTDLEEFISKTISRREEKEREARSRGIELYTSEESRAVKLDEFRIVFAYESNVSNEFNQFTNRPGWIVTGLNFESSILKLSDEEAELGFDYIFINGTETSTDIRIYVYDRDDELVAKSNIITVPLVRSKLTTVRGTFLTTMASGGVGISPGFTGTHNFYVKD